MAETSGNRNRKLQLSVDPTQVNRGLSSDKVTTGMLLQGVIESAEAKGFMVDIGLKDKAKGFIRFGKTHDQESIDSLIGSLAQVVVLGKTSKLIKCSFFESERV